MTLYYDDLVMSSDVELDEELFDYWKNWIEQASCFELVMMERFAPGGHVIFRHGIGLDHLFDKKQNSFGGITDKISKQVGYCKITDVKHNTITYEQFLEIMRNA